MLSLQLDRKKNTGRKRLNIYGKDDPQNGKRKRATVISPDHPPNMSLGCRLAPSLRNSKKEKREKKEEPGVTELGVVCLVPSLVDLHRHPTPTLDRTPSKPLPRPHSPSLETAWSGHARCGPCPVEVGGAETPPGRGGTT